MQYEKWLWFWIDNYVKPTAKNNTYSRYSQLMRNHIIPNFGTYDLNALSPLDIQAMVTKLLENGNTKTGAGLSSNTVNSVISVIQNSLYMAYSVGETSTYVGNKIKRPKISEKQVACFSIEEQKKIEQYVLNHKKDKLFGIVLCLYTGLRIGELLALEWTDIDFAKGILTVNKTCYDGSVNGKLVRMVDTPKTTTSIRIIPLPKQLIPLLKSLKKRSNCKCVIANNDKPVLVRSYQRTFELILKKLSISHKGFHSLRHTFATRALECGMDVKTLSEILGHKNPTITLNRYAHSMLEHKKEMMNRLGKLL